MIMKFNKPLNLALLIYIIIIGLIIIVKPTVFFDNNGEMKCTGCGKNPLKSIFSLPMFIVFSSILIYFTIIYLYQ